MLMVSLLFLFSLSLFSCTLQKKSWYLRDSHSKWKCCSDPVSPCAPFPHDSSSISSRRKEEGRKIQRRQFDWKGNQETEEIEEAPLPSSCQCPNFSFKNVHKALLHFFLSPFSLFSSQNHFSFMPPLLYFVL